MNRTQRIILMWGLSSCAMLLAAPASADENASPVVASVQPAEPMLAPFGAALDEAALASQRGGQGDAFFNDSRSRATISNTSTDNLATGTNAISEGAFANSNGLPMVIQNTGNNVIIQNSTILNLQLR
jgi:hypothetical protein